LKQFSAPPCNTIKDSINDFADGKSETVLPRATRLSRESGSAFCFEFSTFAL
jgi:hypothetical protein